MCAITGLISLQPVDKNNFVAMNNAAAHRGPDDEGYYLEPLLALGHRRLAIIDLTNAGHQPFLKQNLYITYNGEVYNYKELREELKGLGHDFASETDTEVILSAYIQWGEKCVEKFNGMWAFAIYNPQNNSVFCSRDRFGIKPFYYFSTENSFVFASELQQILKYNNVKKELNIQAVGKYLIASTVDDSEDTFFKNIKKLKPGHNLSINTKTLKMQISQFYFANQTNTNYTTGDFSEILRDAVRLRLRSDTPVGSCLSGGLDSSLIVSIASTMSTKGKIQTFTAIPFDKIFDESEYVRKLACDLPLETHFLNPQKEDFHSSLLDVIRIQEEPFLSPSIFMQYFVMQKAHQEGLKVLLDGQGADEILLGYEKYFPHMLLNILQKNPILAFKNSTQMLTNNSNVSTGFLLRQFAKICFPALQSPQIKRFSPYIQNEFLDNSLYSLGRTTRSISAFRIKDIDEYNLPSLLRYEDKNSMHFGIETRLPYLDFRVVDIALKWPIEKLFSDGLGKAPLRQEFNDVLPEYIRNRKSKFNFNAPQNIWTDTIKDLLSKSPSFPIFFKPIETMSDLAPLQQWKMLNLCLWHDHYFLNSTLDKQT
jgi:asparagine synthase (glutamine-hydrolysing)